MPHLGEAGERLAADPLSGRVRGHELRMSRLDLLKFAEKGVVFGVGDLRTVEDVVAVFMVADQGPQFVRPPGRSPVILRHHAASF
jgi:hypothetical protein